MNNNFKRFSEVIEYLENNLESEINYSVPAKMLSVSVYEFRRIFSFAAGVPLYEYIKNRRLSESVFDLKSSALSITEIAGKYRYDSSSAYSRAFRGLFGITPSEAKLDTAEIKLYSKLNTFRITENLPEFSCRIIKSEGFYVCGVQGVSDNFDTVCCESVWKRFEQSEYSSSSPFVAVYENNPDGSVKCTIGKEAPCAQGAFAYVNPSQRMCFAVSEFDSDKVNGIYEQILAAYIPGSGYRRRKSMPNIEIYPEGDTWEIQIPVEEE